MPNQHDRILTKPQRQQIIELRDGGLTWAEIAKEYGTCINTVRRAYIAEQELGYEREQYFCSAVDQLRAEGYDERVIRANFGEVV